MAEWDVVSQAPAPEFEDRWAPVEEHATQDPWTPVQQTPVGGRGIWQAIKDYPEHFVKSILETPQRAFEASSRLSTGEFTPDDAGTMLGAAMLGGVKMGKGVGGARAHPTDVMAEAPKVEPIAAAAAAEWKPVRETPIEAYHGSPHTFDSFDATKIGTGEGAQAYGHGLYFAENMKVAEGYKNDPKMTEWVHGKDWTPAQEEAFQYLHENKMDTAAASEALNKRILQARMYGDTPDSTASLKESKDVVDSGWKPPESQLYKVHVLADKNKFLDWDKPFNEQHPFIQESLSRLFGDKIRLDHTGKQIYEFVGTIKNKLKNKTEGYPISSEVLRDMGIPGIRYLDQNSRSAGEGTRNYVVFDPKHIEVVERNGKPVSQQVKEQVLSEELPATPPVADPLAQPEPSPQQMNAAQSAAKVVKNILNPAEVSPMAERAAGDIRAAGGRAARDTETTRAALDAESRKVSALSDPEKLGLIDYIENRSKPDAPPIREDLKPVADAVKTGMDLRRTKLEALERTEQMQFVQDYYTHLWKDPAAAAQIFSGPAKEGTGRFLKERSVPTVAEGIARGLEPASINPLDVTMRYADSMDRFIASSEVIDKAIKEGNAKHFTPGEQPPGWVEVNTRRTKGPLYAPEDWARIYNNYVDRGIHRNADWGKIYDAARNTSNAITTLELGLSGFHAATMAQEAMVNSVARAISEVVSGKPISAIKSLVTAPISPVKDVVRGRQLEHVYLNKAKGTPLMETITDLLTEAGGRAKGARHAPDYQYTQSGAYDIAKYWDSFRRGAALADIKMAASRAGAEIGEHPVKAPVLMVARQVGRVLQTVAKPLFEYTIPKLKNGAFYENMASWLEANPTADHAMQVKAARKIWNSIDNRFGEVVQDNIFWNKTLKQSLQVALRSYSWTFGTIQEIGGGAKDMLRHPSSLSPKSKHYSPKAAYVIALPIVYATLNAVYQKMKTGKDPESISDVMRGGLSGGTQPGVGGRGEVPERTMMPGYMKDVFGWYHHPVDELRNKIATGPRMVFESLTNKDWKNQPVRNPSDPYPDQVREYFKYVYQSLGPISVKQLLKGNKEGSNITKGETLLGLRPTPQFLQDPEGYERMKKGIDTRDWQKKERYDKKQERQYGGPQ